MHSPSFLTLTKGIDLASHAVLSRPTKEVRKALKTRLVRVKEVGEEIARMGAKVTPQFALIDNHEFLNMPKARTKKR